MKLNWLLKGCFSLNALKLQDTAIEIVSQMYNILLLFVGLDHMLHSFNHRHIMLLQLSHSWYNEIHVQLWLCKNLFHLQFVWSVFFPNRQPSPPYLPFPSSMCLAAQDADNSGQGPVIWQLHHLGWVRPQSVARPIRPGSFCENGARGSEGTGGRLSSASTGDYLEGWGGEWLSLEMVPPFLWGV